ncbi:MAG TPA: succinate dehydrogenase [Deinococcales bacterium]|nr:succinate dehydrogenase [Deinococcales bacterium]
MAIRARRLADARAQARNNTELAWWVFMRLSGVFLVFLTFFHLFQNYIIRDEMAADYDYVVAQYSLVSERLYLFALLALGLMHGVNGLRYGIDDWTAKRPELRLRLKALTYTVVAAIFVFGTLALFVGTPGAIPGGE